MGNKRLELGLILENNCPDLIAVTETHLDNDCQSAEFFPSSYVVFRNDRNRRGGGVCIAARQNLLPSEIKTSLRPSVIEDVWISLHSPNKIIIGCIYKPPNLTLLNGDIDSATYTNLMCDRITHIANHHPKALIVIMGDFNFPKIDWHSNSGHGISENNLMNTLQENNLVQLVKEDSRETLNQLTGVVTGNILDLVITNHQEQVNNIQIIEGTSDHKDIVFNITKDIPKQKRYHTSWTYAYSRADFKAISHEMEAATGPFLLQSASKTVEENWKNWIETLLGAVERHTPKIKRCTKTNFPWINQQVREAITIKERLLKQAKKTKKQEDWNLFRNSKKETKHVLKKSYRNYVSSIFNDKDDNKKKFYKLFSTNNRLHTGVTSLTQENGTLTSENETMVNLLASKFESTYSAENDSVPIPPFAWEQKVPDMSNFIVSQEGVKKCLINLSVNKSMGPDRVHPAILKNCRSTNTCFDSNHKTVL